MALIPDEQMLRLASRKFICALCNKQVDTWERWSDPATRVTGIRFYCHGSTDTAEISEAMINTGRFKTITPFGKKTIGPGVILPAIPDPSDILKLARDTLREWSVDELESIRPLCGACGEYVWKIKIEISPPGEERLINFYCHDKTWSVIVQEESLRSPLFPKALANFRPFLQDRILFGRARGKSVAQPSEMTISVRAGESIRVGQLVSTAADRRIVVAAEGGKVIGIALDSVAPGDYGRIQIGDPGPGSIAAEYTDAEGNVIGVTFNGGSIIPDIPAPDPKPKADNLGLPQYGPRKIDLTEDW